MSDGIICTRRLARSLFAWLGFAAVAAWADCPPGYQRGPGACVKVSMTPSDICSASAASRFPPSSPGYATKETQQKKQEYIEACTKQYEEHAKLQRRITPVQQPDARAQAVAPAPRAAGSLRESAPVRAAAPSERAFDLSSVRSTLPAAVSLDCAKVFKAGPSVIFGAYELTATHTGATPLGSGYSVHWSVEPTEAVSPANGVVSLKQPLAPYSTLALGTVKRVKNLVLKKCTAVAKL